MQVKYISNWRNTLIIQSADASANCFLHFYSTTEPLNGFDDLLVAISFLHMKSLGYNVMEISSNILCSYQGKVMSFYRSRSIRNNLVMSLSVN